MRINCSEQEFDAVKISATGIGAGMAVASWIKYLNQIRIERLLETLQKEETNLNEAMLTIRKTLEIISKDIVNNGKGGRRTIWNESNCCCSGD